MIRLRLVASILYGFTFTSISGCFYKFTIIIDVIVLLISMVISQIIWLLHNITTSIHTHHNSPTTAICFHKYIYGFALVNFSPSTKSSDLYVVLFAVAYRKHPTTTTKMRISAELFYYFNVVGKSNCRCYSSIIFTFFSALYQFPSRYNIFWSSALFTLDFSLIYSFFLLFSFMYFFFYIFFFLWHREREAQEALLALIYKTWPVCIGISTCLCGFISVFTCI